MAYRPLEITVISAKDLKDVNLFSKMEVYAVLSLSNDPRSEQRTPTDREGGKNPNWNRTLRFTVPDGAHSNGLVLHIRLRADRALGDRDVGEVHVPIKELNSSAAGDGQSAQFVSYQVRRPSGNPKGVLNFSYKFGEKTDAPLAPPAAYPATSAYPAPSAYPAASAYPAHGAYPPPSAGKAAKADEPVTAYPVGPGSSTAYAAAAPYPPAGYPAYGAPPPQQGYGYGAAPPQGGYGYPPAAGGYGYGAPPVVQQPARKNRMGMGLGAGLLGGALGGLLIGDMISDSSYDGGYGDCGGGFDF